jgi:hypothetical protein
VVTKRRYTQHRDHRTADDWHADVPFSLGLSALTLHPETARYRSGRGAPERWDGGATGEVFCSHVR